MSEFIRALCEATGLFPIDVREIISRAPVSYKWYTIPKRNGELRLIAQPAREVKVLQRAAVTYFETLPIHVAATAYRRGQSIRANAVVHAGSGPILKYDFADFFPSIKSTDWQAYCRGRGLLEADEIAQTSRLFFTHFKGRAGHRLAIGAPSSPWLSNVLMYEFDNAISRAVATEQVTYSRYADDLTFSARRTGYLTRVDKALRSVVSHMKHPSLKINEAKTTLVTEKYRRTVTGLIIANDGRVTIGRERKREIRAALHHASKGLLDNEAQAKLAGLLAHLKSVEPDHFNRMIAHYGPSLLPQLMAGTFGQFEI